MIEAVINELPELRTIKEVAQIFRKKSERTIRRWIEEGLFPHAKKVKDGWLIPIPDIQRLLQTMHTNGERPSGPPKPTRRVISRGID